MRSRCDDPTPTWSAAGSSVIRVARFALIVERAHERVERGAIGGRRRDGAVDFRQEGLRTLPESGVLRGTVHERGFDLERRCTKTRQRVDVRSVRRNSA
jgi:hypothetical protein